MIHQSIDWLEFDVRTERRISVTEARVRVGELLDGVTARHDVVFVERAGNEVAVVPLWTSDHRLAGALGDGLPEVHLVP